MKCRRLLLVLAGFAAVATAAASVLFAPLHEHWRSQSPDGAFVAVAHTQQFYSLIPAMPGGGNDKPARVTIYRGGQSCGSAWVDMVSFVYDLRWEFDARPRRAEIRLAATWNLDDCSMQILADR